MTQVHRQLMHLARAYFHQDFDLEVATPMDVVRLFASGEPPAVVGELKSDVESVLQSSMNDRQMRELWVVEYGASYDPLADGIEYRRWFADILDVLAS